MKLIQRPNIGQGVHRAGWVSVMGALYKEADGKGMLLDDCVEYSFLFGPNRNRPHVEPWVGIFHFPSCIDSPVKEDLLQHSAEAVLRNPTFHASRKYLQSGIAMTQELASWLTEWLQVPFSVVPRISLKSASSSGPTLNKRQIALKAIAPHDPWVCIRP